MPDKIVFLDIETTGLDPKRHEILEVAGLVREASPTIPDEKFHFALTIDEVKADSYALEVNRYFERREELDRLNMSPGPAKALTHDRLKDALVVGNNIQFDLRFIEEWLGMTPWYYVPLDLKAYASGMCGMTEPASTKFIAELAGVPLTKDAHSALVDAWWNRNVYDSLVNGSFRKFVR